MKTRNLKSLDRMCELYKQLFLDLIMHHPTLAKSLSRDFATLERRAAEEGLGFLTCALPTIAKALIKGLRDGTFECPDGYSRVKGTALPRFLGGLLTQVFDAKGRLLLNPCIIAINDVIQVCQLLYKIDLPYSASKTRKVVDQFKKVDDELANVSLCDEDEVLNSGAVIMEDILKGFDPMNIVPSHGPGAVATGESDEQKWKITRKYAALHRVYPYYEYFVPSRLSLLCRIKRYKDLELMDEGTAKVVLVPKDSRGPRLISMEPLEYQFIQQGLRKALYKHLETKSRITRGYVNFTDQSINQRLAKWNSVSQRYSTLDMAEASDRVSLKLVERLFERCPDVLRSLKATRSSLTMLPDGTLVRMNKFAPMGSALCFPVEALCFFVLARAIAKLHNLSTKVYVYGDDIIVQRPLAELLFKLFPNYGLKFNEGKSFTEGYFRESCGMDCYKGEQVTPVRVKKLYPESRNDGELIEAAIDLSNRLWCKGYWHAAKSVEDWAKPFLPKQCGLQPVKGTLGSVFKTYTAKVLTGCRWRYSKDLQCFEARIPRLVVKTRRSKLSSYSRLFSNLVGQFSSSYLVPQAKQIKLGWIAAY